MPAVRVVAAVIVGVLVLAVIVLYFMPGETERFWAWTITPSMTAMLMGAGYAAGAYFFTRALTTRSWRTVTLGFLPITAFTSLLLIATLIHWDRFNHSHVAFFSWTFLYVVTPVLVPALWLLNRRTDPGVQPGELRLSASARVILVLSGAAIGTLGLVMFLAPGTVSPEWPWELSPLTARVVAAYLALTGGSLALIGWDARWRAAKVLIESLLIGSALIIIAIIRAWGDLDPSETVRWGYLASMCIGLALLLLLYARMELIRMQAPSSRRDEAGIAREQSGP